MAVLRFVDLTSFFELVQQEILKLQLKNVFNRQSENRVTIEKQELSLCIKKIIQKKKTATK